MDTVHGEESPSAEDQALELARRLLTPRHLLRHAWKHGLQAELPRTRLLVGQLPPDYPDEIPFPEGTRIVGSLISATGMRRRVMLDISGAHEGVLRFYDEQMSARGWLHPSTSPHAALRARDSRDTLRTGWFKTEEGPSLLVSAVPRSEGTVDVELTLDLDPEYCRHMWKPFASSTETDLFDIFLRLPLPPGSRMLYPHTAAGSGTGESHVTQALETGLSVAEVLDHYAAQLRNIGWQDRDRTVSASVGVTTWQFHDRDGKAWWVVVTVARDSQTAGHQFLSIQAHREMSD